MKILSLLLLLFSLNIHAAPSEGELWVNIKNSINRYAKVIINDNDSIQEIRQNNARHVDAGNDNCLIQFTKTNKKTLTRNDHIVFDERMTIDFSFADIDPERIELMPRKDDSGGPYWVIFIYTAGNYNSIYYNFANRPNEQLNHFVFYFNHPRHAHRFAQDFRSLINLCSDY